MAQTKKKKRGSTAKEPKPHRTASTSGVREAQVNGRAHQDEDSNGSVNKPAQGNERSARDDRAGTSQRRSEESDVEVTDRDVENEPEEYQEGPEEYKGRPEG